MANVSTELWAACAADKDASVPSILNYYYSKAVSENLLNNKPTYCLTEFITSKYKMNLSNTVKIIIIIKYIFTITELVSWIFSW